MGIKNEVEFEYGIFHQFTLFFINVNIKNHSVILNRLEHVFANLKKKNKKNRGGYLCSAI